MLHSTESHKRKRGCKAGTTKSAIPPAASNAGPVPRSKPTAEANEAPTVVFSTQSQQLSPQDEDGELVVLSSATREPDIVPFIDRLPGTDDVLLATEKHQRLIDLLQTLQLFSGNQDHARFVREYFKNPAEDEFWDKVSSSLGKAMIDHRPTTATNVKKCRDKYSRATQDILTRKFGVQTLAYFSEYTADKCLKLLNLSYQIGIVFIDVFESLVEPPRGCKVIPIEKQLDAVVIQTEFRDVHSYFEDDLCQNVYYTTGFLCRAGQKEAERRKDGSPIALCIAANKEHYVHREEDVTAFKGTLPDGLTDLIDKRSAYGGMSYPNIQLYSLVAMIELCYSSLATSHNLQIFCGTKLGVICKIITSHKSLSAQFAALFEEGRFSEDTLAAAFGYYVSVFGKLRLKDLCRKYNSMLHKTTTVGLRQSLATRTGKGKSSKKKEGNNAETDSNAQHAQEHREMLDIAESE